MKRILGKRRRGGFLKHSIFRPMNEEKKEDFPKFQRGDFVVCEVTGSVFVITEIPHDHHRLESSNETFYVFRSCGKEDDHVLWHGTKSTMENGRFSPCRDSRGGCLISSDNDHVEGRPAPQEG